MCRDMGTSKCADELSWRSGPTTTNDSSDGIAIAIAHGAKASQSLGTAGVSQGSSPPEDTCASDIGIPIAMLDAGFPPASHPNTVAASAVRAVKTMANDQQNATMANRDRRNRSTFGR
jgi:hypothetical protein